MLQGEKEYRVESVVLYFSDAKKSYVILQKRLKIEIIPINEGIL